jgi:hypothetical protein
MKTFLKHSMLIALVVANGQIFTATPPNFSKILPAPKPSRQSQPTVTPEKLADGIVVPLKDTFLKVEVYGDNVVRIACAKDRAFFARKSVMTEPKRAVKTDWSLKTENGEAILSTAKLQVHVNLATGAVSFFDSKGQPILAETADGRTITPAEVQGEQTFHVRQQWEPNADESLYGLGQRQIGIIDIKGWDLDLWQHNTHVVVPFLVSSRGYGVLWDNLSFTRFGDLREFEPIPANCLIDASNQPGGLTTGTFSAAHPDQLETRTPPPISPSSPKTAAAVSGIAGKAKSSRPPPAIINSRPTRTAASKCGWTERLSLTTGGRAG